MILHDVWLKIMKHDTNAPVDILADDLFSSVSDHISKHDMSNTNKFSNAYRNYSYYTIYCYLYFSLRY